MNGLDPKELKATLTQVSIDNKKLTKSIFNQIEYGDCFDHEMNFIGDPVYGYVKDKDYRYLLWTIGGKLRRTSLSRYYELKASVENASLEKTEWFLKKTRLEYEMYDEYRDRLSEGIEDHKRYLELVAKAKEFLKGLIDKQIYL